MAISPSDMEALPVGLCRFQIEAADLAREIAPVRTLQAAACDQACAEAVPGTLCQAILLRDREPARAPFRAVTGRRAIPLTRPARLAPAPPCGHTRRCPKLAGRLFAQSGKQLLFHRMPGLNSQPVSFP